ncbi:MAG: hypothetical protein RLZZ168_423, partial [Cyanobacteriota bacterium]
MALALGGLLVATNPDQQDFEAFAGAYLVELDQTGIVGLEFAQQDALLLLEAHHLFLIADGMGRHAAGEVASQLAVDAVGSAFVTGDFGEFPRDKKLTERGSRLKRAIQVANKRVFEEAHHVDAYAGMGTTVVS